jgi:hypothetical protein
VQGAEEDGDGDVKPGVGGALLQQLGEVHVPTLSFQVGLSTPGIGLRQGGAFCLLQTS